jgi:dTDP-4-amino-4,6-dideoxygalactose transaminase
VTSIPLVDLVAQYESLKREFDEALISVASSAAFVGGEQLRLFESEFAAYCGVETAVGVGNGTDALVLTLKALGIGADDEVITVSHTFTATAEAIITVGALPVFVDIHDDTMLMDISLIEGAITDRTKAIMPVHMNGQMCDMTHVREIADKHDLLVIEDAAQAHGAEWDGKGVGQLSDAATFSFYPAKNLGAFGDGGAVISKDPNIVSSIRNLANHGRMTKYEHDRVGFNSRLDNIQASVLRVKLSRLADWNVLRRTHAKRYSDALASTNCQLPGIADKAVPVWHIYAVRVDGDREAIRASMGEQGVSTGVHYPVPLHLQSAYAELGYAAGSLPVTEKVADSIISLPMFPELTDDQIGRVVDVLGTCIDESDVENSGT